MADITDKADDAADAFFRSALTNKRQDGPKPTGKCYACNAAVEGDARFCDNLCRDDYEYEQRRNSDAGC